MHKRSDTNGPDSLPEILALTRIGGQSLETRARGAQELTRVLRCCLPQDLAPHCLWATSENGTIVVVTSNSSWATRLRFEEKRMLEAANRTESPPATRLRVLVIPAGEWIAP